MKEVSEREMARIGRDIQEPSAGPVRLRFSGTLPGDESKGLVPAYHFIIIIESGRGEVGHINFRVGATRHVEMTAGHIGFAIDPGSRGFGYAYHACRALAPFIRTQYEKVILTADPQNLPSVRTIERLGASFLEEVDVPLEDPAYARGKRRKRRYQWIPLDA